jgi:tetratricopeptide (TPR) repeat protein
MRFLAGTWLTLAMASLLVAQQPAAPSSAVVPQAQASQTASSPADAASQTNNSSAMPAGNPASQSAGQSAPLSSGSSTTAAIIPPPPTRREIAEAKRQFKAGLTLKSKGNLDGAFDKFSSASELDPRNVSYLTAREFAREELAMNALKQGNKAMLDGDEIVAMASFRRALEYDPTNDYALQRLRDSIPEDQQPTQAAKVVEESVPVQLQPTVPHQDFHYRGDARTLLTQVARAYGITAQFDDSVQSRRVHFDIQDVNFATAMEAAMAVTKTFWVPLSAKQILFLADTVENHRNFERMGLRTFFLPELTDQQVTEMTNSLRVLLNLRFISTDKAESAITIRAELPVLEAADRLIKSLTTGRPEVLLDIRVYAVSSSLQREIGTALPTQFTLFNISPALLAGLGASATNLINQLISSGGINQANSTAVSALLGQLQQSSTGSLLTTPFVTFGGGLTLFGLNAGGVGVTPTFSLNESDIRTLEHVTLRAAQNDPAVMKIGERYPIVNATFAPIYNTAAISKVLGNQSYIAPFPSFNFEDIGLVLKATPFIHANQDVTMKLELQLRSLGTTTNNGIPVIDNREYSGNISVKDGESSVITGLISIDDTRGINGYPFLGRIPGLTYASSLHNKNVEDDELLVVITPHILHLPERNSFAVQLPANH